MFDLEQIFNDFSSVTDGLVSAIELGEKIKGLIMSDSKKAEEALTAMNNQLLSVQTALLKEQQLAMELWKQNQLLSEQLKRHDEWNQQKTQYHLTEIAYFSYAYAKTSEDGTPTPPYFCANCFNDQRLALLQFSGEIQIVDLMIHKPLICEHCGKTVLVFRTCYFCPLGYICQYFSL